MSRSACCLLPALLFWSLFSTCHWGLCDHPKGEAMRGKRRRAQTLTYPTVEVLLPLGPGDTHTHSTDLWGFPGQWKFQSPYKASRPEMVRWLPILRREVASMGHSCLPSQLVLTLFSRPRGFQSTRGTQVRKQAGLSDASQ